MRGEASPPTFSQEMISMIDASNGKSDDPVLAAARAYIEKGWAVLPLHRRILGEDGKSRCICGNPNCQAKGKEPLTPHGYKDATTDEETILAYLRKYPRCNLGIATGEASGLLALDIDGPEGRKSLLALEERYGVLPATLTSATGRTDGGEHRFFRYPKGSGIGCPTKVAPGIHVKGIGGYVVTPPSVHESGNVYAWVNESVEIAELPQVWVDLLLRAQGKNGTNTTIGKARGKTMTIEEEKIPKGSRNNRLHEIASTLVHKGKPKDFVLESVLAINDATCNPPLNEAEIREIVESAWNYRDQGKAESKSKRLLRLGLSSFGNGERLNRSVGDNLLWDTEQKRFMVYEGKSWVPDDGDRAQNLARKVIEGLVAEAHGLEAPQDREAMTEFALKCQDPRQIKSALDSYRMDEEKFATHEDFDTHPNFLNCLNGVVNLKTGEMLAHDPSFRLTLLAPVEYHPESESRLWLDFLEDVFQGDPEAIKSFRRQIGYFLTGEMREQKFFVWLGNGRNGKSTIRNVLSDILGNYVGDVSSSAFTVKRFNSESYELADQIKKRMIFSAEITNVFQLDEPLVKGITGGDMCTFRAIYQKPVTARPHFKIVIPCNRVPEIRGMDDGIWDRCLFLHFKRKFEGKERVQDFHKVLLTEREGIFSWMVRASMEWYAEGLFVSQESCEMNTMYRKASDPLGQFLEERCEFGFDKKVGATQLYEEYRRWSEERKETAMSQVKFGTELTARQIHGVKKTPLSGRHVYCGIGLKPDTLSLESEDEGNSNRSSLPPLHL
jgi:putative DNA primase/helicase